MAVGALIQLSAQGIENEKLNQNASHTFWRSSFQKHTGFSMEPFALDFHTGQADFAKSGKVHVERNGDLLCDAWLEVHVNALKLTDEQILAGKTIRWTNDLGRALLKECKITLGGVTYDSHQAEILHVLEELSVPAELHLGPVTGKSNGNPAELLSWASGPQHLYVPLHFWFSRAYSNALPLVSLYQHDIHLNFDFRAFDDLVVITDPLTNKRSTTDVATHAANGGEITKMQVLAEYVYLDSPERNYMARAPLEYLIEQTQFVGSANVPKDATIFTSNMYFNHPTSELIWFFRSAANSQENDWFNFNGEEVAPYKDHAFKGARLLLNSSERYEARDPIYFSSVVPRRCHSRIPRKMIYCYPFALHPESAATDPSGNLNLSRIDNAQKLFTFSGPLLDAYDFFLYARSYNHVRVERGLAKLFFA